MRLRKIAQTLNKLFCSDFGNGLSLFPCVYHPGYQKVLECRDSVPRPKGFCEANKVIFLFLLFCSKLWQFIRNWKFNILFVLNIDFISNRALCERPSLTVRGQASLFKARYLCKRPGLCVRVLASFCEAQPPCERPNIPVRGLTSLWEA